MSKLLIFLDESGTMPIKIETEIFLAAGIGVFDDYPIYEKREGHKVWLVNQLKRHNAIPYISYLNPDEKFKISLQNKLDEIDKLGTQSLTRNGNNKKYFSAYGLERRNLIWIHTVDNCILQIILRAATFKPVHELVIYVDQKSLSDTSLNFIKYLIKHILDGMTYTFTRGSGVGQDFDKQILSNLNLNPDHIRLIWSNEIESLPASCGLELVHYLGYHFSKDFNTQSRKSSIMNLLSSAGFLSFSGEINSFWLRDIDEKTIRDWERNTGLTYNPNSV